MNYYIYRFLNKKNHIIYVGRTNNLATRMSQHFGSQGHLSKACYDEVKRIDYLVLNTRNDMKIKELYYISKYKPHYNTADMHDTSFTLNEIEDVWVTLDIEKAKESFKVHRELEKEKEELLEKNALLRKEKEDMSRTISKWELKFKGLQNAPTKEYVTVNTGGSSEDVSYKRAVLALEENPELVFTNTVEGKVRFLLFSEYGEIWCRLFPHDCKQGTLNEPEFLIMKSTDKSREFKSPDSLNGYAQFQPAILIDACNNWLPSAEPAVESNMSHLWADGLVQESAIQLIS